MLLSAREVSLCNDLESVISGVCHNKFINRSPVNTALNLWFHCFKFYFFRPAYVCVVFMCAFMRSHQHVCLEVSGWCLVSFPVPSSLFTKLRA